jgi:hypothetical protein
VAYVSYDRASSSAAKFHFAWSRLSVLSACVAFWIVAAFALNALI